MSIRQKYIGDSAFYRRFLALAVPVMVQMGITNLVSLIDNVMVGRLGTEVMSGVSIVNQFIFVFNLLIFGAVSGAGIFLVQYFGKRDQEGIRYAFRFKMIVCLLAAAVGVVLFLLLDETLISLFLYDGSVTGDLGKTMTVGKQYLQIILVGLVPYALSQVYASTLKETEQTVVPMISSFVALGTNVVLNFVLIFGFFGIPAMGAVGAAIATVVARFAELAVLLVWAYTHPEKCPYLRGALRSLYIPRRLLGSILLKGLPLMINELLWSLSVTMRNQCYATRGLDAVAAQNICSTILNVFSVCYMSVGAVITVIVGGYLGAGQPEQARDANRKLLVCSCGFGIVLGGLLALTSPLFPLCFNTEPQVRELAMHMMMICGLFMPFYAYSHSSYFSVRSGGKVGTTFLMDSGYMWLLVVPAAFLLSRFTSLDILLLFTLCQGAEIFKAIMGFCLICRGNWLKRLV